MAGLLDCIRNIKGILRTISDLQTVKIWNNQFKYMRNGEEYAFAFPAGFVEVVSPQDYTAIGEGLNTSDLVFCIHIGNEMLNAIPERPGDAEMEEDERVFSLRDQVIRAMSRVKIDGCGPFALIGEAQDYEHDNVYEYLLFFKAHFVDATNSPYDPVFGTLIEKQPPIAVTVNVGRVDFIKGQPNEAIRSPLIINDNGPIS